MVEYYNWMGRAKPKQVAQVIDPSMSAEARSRLVRKIRGSESQSGETLGCSVVALSFVSAVTLVILHHAIDLSWWWMFASLIPILIGTIISGAVIPESLDSQDYSHFVRGSDLDGLSHDLMARTQEAIRRALGSRVHANNSLNHPVEEPTLRRHEWEIATALRKISKLRSELEASGSPGPMTAKVLDSHQHAVSLATNATTSRVRALERYAAELEKADDAERDWRAALKASGRNDQYIDLVAGTAADELAIAEIEGLTEQASAAAQIFRAHLYKASLAAQALVLPTAR